MSVLYSVYMSVLYSGTSVFVRLHTRTIRVSTKNFESKMLLNSNRISEPEHPSRAERGRKEASGAERATRLISTMDKRLFRPEC